MNKVATFAAALTVSAMLVSPALAEGGQPANTPVPQATMQTNNTGKAGTLDATTTRGTGAMNNNGTRVQNDRDGMWNMLPGDNNMNNNQVLRTNANRTGNITTRAADDADTDWGWLGLLGLVGLAGLMGRNRESNRSR